MLVECIRWLESRSWHWKIRIVRKATSPTQGCKVVGSLDSVKDGGCLQIVFSQEYRLRIPYFE